MGTALNRNATAKGSGVRSESRFTLLIDCLLACLFSLSIACIPAGFGDGVSIHGILILGGALRAVTLRTDWQPGADAAGWCLVSAIAMIFVIASACTLCKNRVVRCAMVCGFETILLAATVQVMWLVRSNFWEIGLDRFTYSLPWTIPAALLLAVHLGVLVHRLRGFGRPNSLS